MPIYQQIACVTFAALLGACASKQPQSTPQPQATVEAPASAPQVVKSRDGSFSGEIIGTVVANSKFASLQIGMSIDEVQSILDRVPDRMHTYESGKRWIPFYFGTDSKRMEVLYKGEGCLVFTHGNNWGGGGGTLISIHHDATGACYPQ
jgi:hypothetical protein